MHFTWGEFRKALQKELTTPNSLRIFQTEKIQGFKEPLALVSWLLRYKDHPISEEDAVLDQIHKIYSQEKKSNRSLWISILFLGLWPSFHWILNRINRFINDDSEAISALWNSLIVCMDKEKIWQIDKDKKPGIAKRLRNNVWNEVKKDLFFDSKENNKLKKLFTKLPSISTSKIEQVESIAAGETQESEIEGGWSLFSMCHVNDPSIPPPKSDIAEIYSLLTEELGLPSDRADVIIQHVVYRKKLIDIAQENGIPYPTLRQRYSRSLKKLRSSLKN